MKKIRSGEGTYTYKDGSIFIGKFKNNEKDGIGQMTYFGRGSYYGTNFKNVSLISQANSSMDADTEKDYSPTQIKTSTLVNGKKVKNTVRVPTSSQKKVEI